MFKWLKNKKGKGKQQYEEVDISLEQLRQAIRAWEDAQPKGVYRSILVEEDNRINTDLLLPYLSGKPKQTYYMSKSTYETFEEKEKEIAQLLDRVQAAVDKYIRIEEGLPIIDFDADKRVNYFLLESKGYLKETPPITLYLTDDENMITHRKPTGK